MNRNLNRREALVGMGSVSLGALLVACGADDESGGTTEVATGDGTTATVEAQGGTGGLAELFDDTSACSLTPEETEGPYYFDVDSIRSDIREDRQGVPLRLAIRIRDRACEPLENAAVDIWHCDANGTYSGFESASQGGPGGGGPGGGSGPTDEETYLRGAQVTDAGGIVQFTTVYPGWYPGRTVHIHAKVHVNKQTVLTTQLYFDEGVTEQVYEREPYNANSGRDTLNEGDSIFDEALLLDLRPEGKGYLGLISFDTAAA